MVQQIIIYILTITIVVVVLTSKTTTAEPINRHLSKLQSNDNNVKSNCADKNECHSVILNNNQSLIDDEKNSNQDVDSLWNFENFFDDGGVNEARKKKKKGMGKIFVMMAAAAKATLMWVAVHAIAVLAGKAFIVGKIALILATIAILKKSDHHDKNTYEIVKHPQYSHVQTHSSSVDYDHSGASGGGGTYDGHRRRKRFARRN